MKISVPATSANLGPGFDSCGLAVNRYLTIEILEPTKHWLIEHQLGAEVPSDETNLLVQTALTVAADLPPHHLIMTSQIPLARGLGSSSSVIVAGIELANVLGDLALSVQEKLTIATQIEGHPDNVAPAILGDLVIASAFVDHLGEARVVAVKQPFPECEVIAYIPKVELLTKTSRGVLPEVLPYKEAVQASSIANVMIAAVAAEDLTLVGEMMMEDRWHEPYRQSLVPHLAPVRELVRANGAYGACLSGAGPTVFILSPMEQSAIIVEKLVQLSDNQALIERMQIDRQGVQVSLT